MGANKKPFNWRDVNMRSRALFNDTMGKNVFVFVDATVNYAASGSSYIGTLIPGDGKGRTIKPKRYHFTGQL